MTSRNAILAIAVGGLIAGALDLLQACILFGWDIPLSIAGGLLGPKADNGGAGTYLLGVLLHFFIACSAAAIYYLASRPLGFLKQHPLVCGLFFGGAVELFMRLIVLPLSALHAHGPYELHDLQQGLIVHMVVIGPAHRLQHPPLHEIVPARCSFQRQSLTANRLPAPHPAQTSKPKSPFLRTWVWT